MKKIYWIFAFILALILSFIFDKEIVLWFFNHRIESLNSIVAFIVNLPAWALFALLTLLFIKKLRHVLLWWSTYVITGLVRTGLKYVFH